MRTVLIVALLIAAAVAALMILRPSGPRVTQITRRRERRNDVDDGENRGE